ncbi:tetratricopeptide repeat protein [Desulfolutivibrio sulfoxidireducens]|uniref:tetratricopeptide repeat protein n=1 Tax=Desulfolutivibrio sulfoxidireducens TaxID=2773299 RepID=UPI00159D64DD|nr:tetratricopeptide repeat protein [Desulfolutivibrio sulfoxidireducens]QLA15353.1 tetratricopeptide repeat protein [Desulfolutivibrio sulfoxidireducens]QLA18932.1 tetratricopeptide repeat protein [Desulfolutivibrio sulfoxidireducens]
MAETDDRHPLHTPPKGAAPSSGKPHDRIKGVFSTQSIQRVGTGTTTRKTIQKMYWFVEERGDKLLDIQPLNKNYIPTGPKRKITMEELLEKFAPEPEFYVSTVYPKMRELNMTIVKGETHRRKGEIFSAELEFGQALAVDEENVRANFGLGLTYLDRGEANKAQDIFERLVRLDAAFDQEHKHLFNEFGINLRKNKMLDQALDYYKRAETLADADENLHYNIARAFFEKKDMEMCFEYLKKALDINPDLVAAKKFLAYLTERQLLPGQAAPHARPSPEEPTQQPTGHGEGPGKTPPESAQP